MRQNINPQLVTYIETKIIPRYKNFDAAHQTDHAISVIKESLSLATYYNVNLDMVYTIAAFHDTGLAVNRATHHLVSGSIIRRDLQLRSFFTEDEIELMAEAAEDHRASSNREPRSIYGMIVAEADRCIDPITIVRRTIQYGLSHYPKCTKEEHYKRFLEHMQEKYAEGGYLKIWLKESTNAMKLKDFQMMLKDERITRKIFEENWQFISSKNLE